MPTDRRYKEALQIAGLAAWLSLSYAAALALAARLFGRPWGMHNAIGDLLGGLLWFLWWGHVLLYRPRTGRQRLVSWVYLFVLDLARCGVRDVVKDRDPLAGADTSAVVAAYFATLAVVGVWLFQRHEARRAMTSAPAASVPDVHVRED